MRKYWHLLFKNGSVRQTIAKNTFWLYFGYNATRLIKFVLVIFAARILGASEYGSFTFGFAILGVVFILADPGISGLLVREWSKNELDKKELLRDSFHIKILATGVAVIVAFLVRMFVPDQSTQSIFVIVLLLFITLHVRDYFLSIAKAKEQMQLEAFAVLIEGGLATLLGLGVLFSRPSLENLAWAYLLSGVLSLIFTVFAVRERPIFFQKPVSSNIKKLLRISLPFALVGALSFVLTTTDTLMLGFMKTPADVGYYSVGTRLIQVLTTLSGLFAIALFPTFSRLHSSKEQLLGFVKKSSSFLAVATFPILIGGIITAPKLIVTMFGAQYEPGVRPFQILLVVLLMLFFVIVWDRVLFALDKQKQDMYYTAIAAGLNVVLNLFFIYKWGLIGAAVATVLAQSVNLVLTFRLTKNELSGSPLDFKQIQAPVVASVVMAGFLLMPFVKSLHVFGTIPAGALVYVLVLYFLKPQVIADVLAITRRPSS